MHVEHVALYVHDLERSRAFYERWFGAIANARYDSRNQPGFSSYFLSFPAGGTRVELMTHPQVSHRSPAKCPLGYAHLAIQLGSRPLVDELFATMQSAGVIVHAAPRVTGDGYYEATVEDPDGNTVEIMA